MLSRKYFLKVFDYRSRSDDVRGADPEFDFEFGEFGVSDISRYKLEHIDSGDGDGDGDVGLVKVKNLKDRL